MEIALLTQPPQLHLLTGPRRPVGRLAHQALARAAQAGPVYVLDCGGRFDGYGVARLLGGDRAALERVTVARAFTCFQALALLRRPAPGGALVLALDLPATFQDENVAYGERTLLLERSITALEELARGAAVLVTAAAGAGRGAAAGGWALERLQRAAGRTWRLEPAGPDAWQPGLL
ncbi:MAG: hypothetical protein ACKOC5_04405 [Chloroflexota bacterium]